MRALGRAAARPGFTQWAVIAAPPALGEEALARAYYTWANRDTRPHDELSAEELQERAAFRAEAEILMGK